MITSEINLILNDTKKNKLYLLNPAYIKEIFFIEDISKYFITGQFDFEDRGGVFDAVPVTGHELIEVEVIQNIFEDEYDKRKLEKKLIFEIFDIKLVNSPNAQIKNYRISLVEQGFFELIGSNFSVGYKEKKISEIIELIIKYQLNAEKNQIKYDIEETDEKIDFISPYWKPATAISYLSKIACRNKSPKESGFIFYSCLENKDETRPIKKFTSLATILEQKPLIGPSDRFYLRDNNKSPYYYNNILEMKNPSYLDKKGFSIGLRGRTLFGINFHTDKKILKESITLSDFAKKAIFLGETLPFIKDIENSSSDVQTTGLYNLNQIKNTINHKFRIDFSSINIREICCKGILDRWAGRVIEIEEGSTKPNEIINEKMSGIWLIKKVVHHFSMGEYNQKMVILKDSYTKFDTDAGLISAGRKNV